ncbi:hypothetical protein CANCADRAFT_17995, partial [Tortispora caseinolytica NRRL Y-17796]
VNAITWSPDSSLLAAACDDGIVKVYDLDGTLRRSFTGHTHSVMCVAFNPKGNLLVSGSFDENVRIWDIRRGRCIRTFPAHAGAVSAVDVTFDSTMILSCSYDGLTRLWDISVGQCLKTLVPEHRPGPVLNALFSPNAQYLLAATADGIIRIWDYLNNRILRTYSGHKCSRYSCPVVVSDSSILSGSEDGAVYQWDINSSQLIRTYKTHSDSPILAMQ